MKKLATSIFALLLYCHSFAQAIVTVTDYSKMQEPAVQYEMPYPENTVESAIQEKLEKSGYKGKDSKGYTLYRSVRSAEIGPDIYNLYFKVEKKNKNDKGTTVITLMITKDDIFVSESTDNAVVINAKKYLQNLKATVLAYDLEQQINAQNDAIKKADKKLNELNDDAAELVKKQAKVALQIQENTKFINTQKGEIDKQHLILETLKGQRK